MSLGDLLKNPSVWGKVVASVQMVSGIVSMVLYVKNLVTFGSAFFSEESSKKVDWILELKWTVYVAWAVSVGCLVFWIIMGLVLMFGVIRMKPSLMTAWLIFGIISLVLSVVYLIIIIAVQPSADRIIIKIVDILNAPVGIWAVILLKRDTKQNKLKGGIGGGGGGGGPDKKNETNMMNKSPGMVAMVSPVPQS